MKFLLNFLLIWTQVLSKWLVLGVTLSLILATSAQELEDHTYSSEAIERGSRIYSRECALCHGPQGDIVDGVNLRTGLFRNVRSDEDLRRVVYSGAGEGQMPAFGLSDNDLNAIVAYIRAGFDPEGVAIRIGDPARGQTLFEGKGECASCHRIDGVGPRTAPDFQRLVLFAHRLHYKEIYWILLRRYYQLTDQFGS